MRHRDVGLLLNDQARATPGLTLITPLHCRSSFLIGMRGEILHQWDYPLVPGNYARLIGDGHILWAGETPEGPKPGGGKGGLIREYDWDGNIVWEYADDAQHHDFRRLKNGNTVYIGWEKMPAKAAKRVIGAEAGSEADGVIWGDYLREVTPQGDTAWEWHAHADMDIEDFPLHIMSTRKEFLHCNAVTELSNGDLMVSFRKNSTIAIIAKKTKKFRWHHGDNEWGQQHDCEMLDNGNILFFANGIHVPRGVYHSRVIELDPETRETVWEYKGTPTWSLFSPNISGAQRLEGGNTLICEGLPGRVFEVTPAGEIVWEYICPFFGDSQNGPANSVFRAYRYAADSPEIGGRVALL